MTRPLLSPASIDRTAGLGAGPCWPQRRWCSRPPARLMRRPPAAAASDPVVAKVNGVEIHQSDLAFAEEDIGPSLPANTGEAKRDYLITYLTDMILLSKAAEAQEDRRRRRLQAPARVRPQQGADGDAAVGEGKARGHRRGDAARSMTKPSSRWATSKRCMRATSCSASPTRTTTRRARRPRPRSRRRSPAPRRARTSPRSPRKSTEDPARQAERRRPRLLHQGPDGAGIRRGGVQARQGPDLRSGEDPVRLARHQGRGQAQARSRPTFDKVKDQLETYVVRKAQVDLVTKLRADAKIERLDKPAAGASPRRTQAGRAEEVIDKVPLNVHAGSQSIAAA